MNEAEFWDIVETTRIQSGDSIDKQGKLLGEALGQLEPEKIISFFHIYCYLHNWAYRAELCAAAILINGGCSDDGFSDFRDWLILQGKEKYYQAIDDPDTLIAIALFGKAWSVLYSTIRTAYERKTGTRQIPYPDLDDVEELPEIDGSKLEPTVAMQLFPKLGAKSREVYDWEDL